MDNKNIKDIEEIRKLIIQNLNLSKSVAASMKSISDKIGNKEQSETLKTLIVTIGFSIVVIVAFFFYFKAEVSYTKDKLSLVKKQTKYLKKDIEEQKNKLATIENNNIKAYNLYITLKEGDPAKALQMYNKMDLSTFSRLERMIVDNKINMIRQKAALKKFEEGNTLFNRKSYEAALKKYKESLEISSTGEHVPKIFYNMALAFYRLKQYSKAAITFERFLFVNTKKSFEKDKAELLEGVCFEKMKQFIRAVNFYTQILKENKLHRFKPTIRDRLKRLLKKLQKQKEERQALGM